MKRTTHGLSPVLYSRKKLHFLLLTGKKTCIIKKGRGSEADGPVFLIKTMTKNNSCSGGLDWRLLVHLRPWSFYDMGRRPAGPDGRALLGHERLSHSAMHESNSRGADGPMLMMFV